MDWLKWNCCWNKNLVWCFLLITVFMSNIEARALMNECPEVTTQSGTYLIVNSPVLQYTVTSFDPAWFSTEDAQKAPTLFTVAFTSSLSALPIAPKLRLRLLIQADTSRGKSAPSEWLSAFDRQSAYLTAAQLQMVMRSNDVFGLDFEGSGIAFDQSELYNAVVKLGRTPEMNLHFKFALTCEDSNNPVNTKDFYLQVIDPEKPLIGKLRFVKTVQAIYPGSQIQNAKPASIYTLNPIFKIASELFNNLEFQYPDGEPKMEIFLYELGEGQVAQDAMDGIEYAKFPLFGESAPVPYPPNLPMLMPGKTYVWRARARLRGPATEYLYSNALYFKVDERLSGNSSYPYPEISDTKSLEFQIKYADDYAKRVMAALKIILGENFEAFDLTRANKIPVKGQIRLNGHPYSIEELERLAKEFQLSKHSVSRLRLQ